MAERLVADHSYSQALTLAFLKVMVNVAVVRGEDLETTLKHLENHDPVLVRETYLEALRAGCEWKNVIRCSRFGDIKDRAS